MRWMKMEKRIVDLDIAIRSALHHEEPDMARSLILISELHSLAIQPLMLKKLPNIVMTLRKVRKYIGPKIQQSDPKVNKIMYFDLASSWGSGRPCNLCSTGRLEFEED